MRTVVVILGWLLFCPLAVAGNEPAGDSAVGVTGIWPWASQNVPDPPPVPPYEIPTFTGRRGDFRDDPVPLVPAPRIDGDAVFRAVVACYPAKTRWRLDIDLEARLRDSTLQDVTGTEIGRNYVAIVGRLPLYSADAQDREREREYRRRVDTARTVADFVGAIAERNLAVRRLSLNAALEQRARVRVNEGIADAEEQTKYLDRVADSESKLVRAEADIARARLALVSMCRDGAADSVNEYLAGLAQLPR